MCQYKPNEVLNYISYYNNYNFINRDTGSSAIHQDRGVNIEPHVFELYIDLMCQYKPNEVLNYIKMNEGYRLEQTLQVLQFPPKS